MVNAMADGTLNVKEGSLFWKSTKSSNPAANGRPTLLFFHAGVTDHTLWDAQVVHFNEKGWHCLTYDRFGFGRSTPSNGFLLHQDPRPAVDHVEHVKQLVEHVLPASHKVVVIGLSMGSALTFDVVDAYPELVCGMASIAGGPSGCSEPNVNAPEEKHFSQSSSN